MASTKTTVVALFQGSAKEGDVEANLSKMITWMQEASKRGAELIIFSELFVTDYVSMSEQELKTLTQQKDGPAFKRLSAAAKDNNIAVIYGYPEVEVVSGETCYYNSAQFIDSEGNSLVNYRKTHLWLCDKPIFTPGLEFSVVEWNGIKVGLLICFDIAFPEPARILALKGAQLIVVPTAMTPEYIDAQIVGSCGIRVRAQENRVFVAYVNHSGGDYVGHSSLCDPKGNVIVQAGAEETLLLSSVCLDELQQVSFRYLPERRPRLYEDLVATTSNT
ncbi:hypothetical protein EMCRGX_G026988 [Ephydatia muelleri]